MEKVIRSFVRSSRCNRRYTRGDLTCKTVHVQYITAKRSVAHSIELSGPMVWSTGPFLENTQLSISKFNLMHCTRDCTKPIRTTTPSRRWRSPAQPRPVYRAPPNPYAMHYHAAPDPTHFPPAGIAADPSTPHLPVPTPPPRPIYPPLSH